MGRKAVGPMCCVMHVKEPRTLIVKEKGLAPVFLDSRLEHPAGWICAGYKSSALLLLLLLYSSIAAILAHIGLIKHNNQLCPHRYPSTPGWREAIMVKCLAQGHKHHGRGRDSNPHSDDSAIRTQIRCTKPLGHGTLIDP